MTTKKKIKSLLYSLLITLFLFTLFPVTIILYPQPLFANKVEYKQFNVYSNNAISHQIATVLDSVISVVENSDLYDSTYQVDLFLSYNTLFDKIDEKIFGSGPTAKALLNNIIFKCQVDVNENLVYSTFHKPCEQSFSYVLVHELIHCLQAHRYGILKFNPFVHPVMWKLEGYPEYVARQKYATSTLSLKEEIKRFTELKQKQTDIWISIDDGGCEAPDYYYKGRILTEYLINIKGWTYDQILYDKNSEQKVYEEMMEWWGGKGEG